MNIRYTLPLGLAVSLSACAPQPSAPSVQEDQTDRQAQEEYDATGEPDVHPGCV